MAKNKERKTEVSEIATMTGEDKYDAIVSLVTINNSIEVIEKMYLDFLLNNENTDKMKKEYDTIAEKDKIPFEAYCFLRYSKALTDSLKKLII